MVARFFLNASTPATLVVAQGTWTIYPGIGLDVDELTEEIFIEAFGGLLIASSAAPPVENGLLGDRTEWLPYSTETVTWATNDASAQVTGTTPTIGIYNHMNIAAVASAQYTFSASAVVADLGGGLGWWPWMEFYNASGDWLSGTYTQSGNRVTTTGARSVVATAPLNTAFVSLGIEMGDATGPTSSKEFVVSGMSLYQTASTAPLYDNTVLLGSTVLVAAGVSP